MFSDLLVAVTCAPGAQGRPRLRLAFLALCSLAASLPRPSAADDARAQFARASEAVKAGRFDEAVDAYQKAEALALGPAGRANAANGEGFVFLKLRRYAEAIPCFQRAVAGQPRHKTAWNNLGVCYLKRYASGLSGTDELDSARAAFAAAAEIDPAFHPEHRKAVQEFLDQDAACAALARTTTGTATPSPGGSATVAQEPPPPLPAPAAAGTFVSYRTAGDLAEDACAFDLARANYERAEAVATNKRGKSAAANLLGLLALNIRSPQAAVDAFRRATLADPGSKFAWNNLGVALLRLYDAGTGGKELVEQSVDAFGRVAAIDAAYKPENLAWSQSILTELGGPTLSATTGLESGTATRDSAPR